MLGGEPASRDDERGVAVRQRDPYTGRHQRPVAGGEVDGFGRHKVGTGVAGVGVTGHDCGDNGDINGFSHPTRLMQNSDARPRYRERLSPSLWLLVTVALAGPMASLVVVRLNSTIALMVGAAVSALLVAGFIALAPTVCVIGTVLHAGRAHIDVRHLGDPVAFVGDAARQARGPALTARGWHLIRGGIDGVVVVPNIDKDDPVDAWTISSRTPDRLAAAIRAARN